MARYLEWKGQLYIQTADGYGGFELWDEILDKIEAEVKSEETHTEKLKCKYAQFQAISTENSMVVISTKIWNAPLTEQKCVEGDRAIQRVKRNLRETPRCNITGEFVDIVVDWQGSVGEVGFKCAHCSK